MVLRFQHHQFVVVSSVAFEMHCSYRLDLCGSVGKLSYPILVVILKDVI